MQITDNLIKISFSREPSEVGSSYKDCPGDLMVKSYFCDKFIERSEARPGVKRVPAMMETVMVLHGKEEST